MDARRPAAHPRGRTLPSILLLVLAVTLAACGSAGASPTAAPRRRRPRPPARRPRRPPSPSPVAAFPVTLTDDEGTSVTIPAEPEQIVTLTNAATETMFALGLGDRVVGKVEDFTRLPARGRRGPGRREVRQRRRRADRRARAPTSSSPAARTSTRPSRSRSCASWAFPTVVIFAEDMPGALADIELMGTRRRQARGGGRGPGRHPGRDRRGHGRDRGPRQAARVLRARRDERVLRPGARLLRHRDDRDRRRRPADQRHGRRVPDRAREDPRVRPAGRSSSATRPTA